MSLIKVRVFGPFVPEEFPTGIRHVQSIYFLPWIFPKKYMKKSLVILAYNNFNCYLPCRIWDIHYEIKHSKKVRML